MKSGKLKKILTSRITVGIVCFLLGGIVLGGQSEQPMQQVNNSQQSQEQNSTGDNSNNNTESDDKSQSSSSSGLTQMQLGESYTITTSDGDYNVAIEGIRFTDERNQFSEKPAEYVIFLDFNYENVSSTDEVYLFDSHFKVIDEQGNVLDTYPVSDDARGSKSLPIGAKCSASATYAMPTSSKTLKVLFYDNMFGSPIGEMTIETGL
ncbi:hypothetical protein [Clostridium sp. K04]|uniref:hypothetical protein n=1 Tax=Clostridium sp. K04 TaxID=2718929 RepID=UPI001C8BE08E|nr:hypothetical protein [Clostridium sp. K04]MBX9185677.1 hypothetical protein [Clostridium sp. K04]